MIDIYAEALGEMEVLFSRLARTVPPSRQVSCGDSFVFRYAEGSAEQAIVQKVARSVSTLHAAVLLLRAGHYQEVASLQRILDDLHEEVVFLALAVVTDHLSDVHQKYLDGFFMEVIDDAADPLTSAQKRRRQVTRAQIRKAIGQSVRQMGPDGFPDYAEFEDATRIVSNVYSGFVHGGSPQIMEMYAGVPRRFHLRGMLGTRWQAEHEADLRSQVYRTAASFTFAAMAVRYEALVTAALSLRQRLAVAIGLEGRCAA